MQERCCEKDETAGRGYQSLGDMLTDSQNRFALLETEVEKKIAEIETCPGPCTDGTVAIELQRGDEKFERHVPCPLLGPDCAYGTVLKGQIDGEIAGLLVSRIGVPRRHVSRFGRRFDTAATREAARWGLRGFLVLSGRTGCGKSFGAAWFVDRHIRSRIGDPFKSEAWAWHARAESAASGVIWSGAQSVVEDKGLAMQAKSCALLVLDDLGKECELPSALAIMRDVVSKRYDNELPTIVTTELTIPDIEARYGRAVAERIVGEAEDGGRFISCGDTSLRLVKA